MNTHQNILVCITQQKTCERLILKASSMLEEFGGELFVIHVAKEEWNFLDNKKEGEALEYLFAISKSVGANLSVLRSNNITDTIAFFILNNKISCVVMGQSAEPHKENEFEEELKRRFPNLQIRVIPQE